ncbi:DUF490 domain-containing protein [Bacteroidia bacterium]|nr:DUF490 domain-containing protein [Bacteroidia bacterium]
MLILLVYILLCLPPVQQKIKDIALAEIMKKTHNQMSIGELRFRPFNQIQLKEVYANDLQGDTLLYVEKLSAGFDLFKLLDNQLLIQSVDLENFVANVQKDSMNGDFNFQFLIDAFASGEPDTTTSSSMTIQIHDIKLKEGRLHYDILSEPALKDSLFDYNHIHLSHLQSDIDLNSIDMKHLDIRINQLAFIEKSGLNVNRLQLKIKSEEDNFQLQDLLLKLPNSQLNINSADYYPPAPLKRELESAANTASAKSPSGGLGVFSIGLTSNIDPADLKMFYSGLTDFPDKLSLSGEINGTLPQISITQLQADYGEHIHLKLTGSIDDYSHWEDTPVQLDLERLSVDASGIEEIMHLVLEDKKQKLPVKPGAISLNGTLNGTLKDLSLHLTADSDRGAIQLEGTGGYDYRTKDMYFDAALQSELFDVETLLQDKLYGLAGLQLQAEGKIPASGKMNIKANARIDRFDLNGYSYNRIEANSALWGDSILLNVYSDDNNVPLTINALADIGKKTPGVKLDARLNCIYMDTLHWLPNYKDVFLIAQIRADVAGLDPEKMQVNIAIDSLNLVTDKGNFNEPHFNLAYAATANAGKHLDIASDVISARADGHFTYAGLLESVKETFPMLFHKLKLYPKKKDKFPENLDFRIGMNHVNSISNLLELPQTIPDSVLFMGKYTHDGQNMHLSASAYTRFMESDTLQLSVSLSNKANNLAVIFNMDNKSANYDLDGSIDAEVEFVPVKGSLIPDMNIVLNPTAFVLNETDFNFNPAQIEVRKGKYSIHNLSLDYADHPDEYIKAAGVISASGEDSLTVDISQFQLATLFGAIKTDIPLLGMVNGRITARSLLSTPFILSRNFAINNIIYDKSPIGDLNLSSGWSSQRNGLVLRATLSRDSLPPSVVTGIVLPEKDSMSIRANIRDIELKWLQDMMAESLYGLDGNLSANLNISGKIKNPVINGMAYLNNAKVGIKQLNTLYSINDSIVFSPDKIELKKFTILDENQHRLTANGKITHDLFSGFTPDISLSLSDFLVINNPRQTDSLFYGNLRVNGLLTVKQNNKDWLISGNITHSDDSKITVNIPSSASMAERYTSITYINTENENDGQTAQGTRRKDNASFKLPLKINTSFWFDPSLTIGAVFNQATGDLAQVAGNGMLKFAYDMNTSAMSLSGDYEVESGNASLSLVGIKKTFDVERGGKLVFHGDPMATTFSVTALYNLRADLTGLDPSFGNIGLVNTKVPVSISLTATGSIDKMALEYDILLPNETDDTQRKVDGLLYTDDIKIKEIAYLLALGSFYPPASSAPSLGSPNLMNSLASLTSGGLNKLLDGILSDNWSIGTDVNTGNNGLNDMAINVSGSILNNRLTINGTVGYHNNSNQMNNFTGDFDVEYKLVPSGNLVLKGYNVTNNQYYEQATTTQGVGVVYKREARTFRKLFDKFRKKK